MVVEVDEIARDEGLGFLGDPAAGYFLEGAAEGAGVVRVVVGDDGDVVFAGDVAGDPGGLIGVANFDEVGLFAFDDFGDAVAGYEQAIAAGSDEGQGFHFVDAGIEFGADGVAVRGDDENVV